MTFSQTHRKCVGMLAALATCAAIITPTASATVDPRDPRLGASADTETVQPSHTPRVDGVGATLQPVPGGNGPVGAFPAQPESPASVVVRFDGLPAGTVGVPSGELSRPAPADSIAAQEPRPIPATQAYADAYEALQRYVPGGLATQVEADNWRSVYGVPADVPEFSTDGPRTAPDALVRPAEQLPVAEPGFDWTDAGIGIAIGAIAGLMLGAALLFGRRRGTLAGA